MLSFESLLCGWILIQSAIIYGQCTHLERCPQNEIYVRCVNPCNTCAERGVSLDKSKQHCAPGCDCITGYFRNSYGKCVPEHLCDGHQCKRDEQYYAHKPDCKNTCENYNNPGVCCPTGKPGCFCKKGLVKRKDGMCVRPEDCCQGTCGPNEEYKACGTACQPTCDNPNPICTKQCAKGCFCKKGFIRATKNGPCIDKRHCRTCGPNEEYKACGTACQPTCHNPNPICTKHCAKGCFCKKGFIRATKNGPCIDKRFCIHKPPCHPIKCPKGCYLIQKAKPCPICDCGKPTDTCGPNEEYKACGTACQPTCDNPNPICTKHCAKGCFCKKGFIRPTKNGPCIDKRYCGTNCPQYDCRPGCYLDWSIKPCPLCKCYKKSSCTNCPQYDCRPGCYLDWSIKPCPLCKCYKKSSGEPEPFDDQYESRDDSIAEDAGPEESFFNQQVEDEANDEEATEERGEQESYEASEDDESERDEDSAN